MLRNRFENRWRSSLLLFDLERVSLSMYSLNFSLSYPNRVHLFLEAAVRLLQVLPQHSIFTLELVNQIAFGAFHAFIQISLAQGKKLFHAVGCFAGIVAAARYVVECILRSCTHQIVELLSARCKLAPQIYVVKLQHFDLLGQLKLVLVGAVTVLISCHSQPQLLL